jgi:hypothetical protein
MNIAISWDKEPCGILRNVFSHMDYTVFYPRRWQQIQMLVTVATGWIFIGAKNIERVNKLQRDSTTLYVPKPYCHAVLTIRH